MEIRINNAISNTETMTEKEVEYLRTFCDFGIGCINLHMSLLNLIQVMVKDDEIMKLMMMNEKDRNAYYYIKDLSYRKLQESMKSTYLGGEFALLECERMAKLFADKRNLRSI